MKDPLTYTYDGIERELNLLEIHLKEAPKGDEAFCKDCIDKHISTIRGFAIEGPSFTDDDDEQERFLLVEKEIRKIKGQDYKKKGVEFSQKVRNIRKSLYDECQNCKTLSKSEIEDLAKDLNNHSSFNILSDENHTHNSSEEINLINKKMTKTNYMDMAYMNAGQFAAEGAKYLLETYPTAEPGKWDKYGTIGGGIGLQVLALFVKMPPVLKQIALVTGSNLLAGGVVKMVKSTEPVVTVGAKALKVSANAGNSLGGFAGKPHSYAPTFGGPTFAGKVTASNIPSQYARAGILSGAQAFESPEHADLIRVD